MGIEDEETTVPEPLPNNVDILCNYVYAVDDSQGLGMLVLTSSIGEKSYGLIGYPGMGVFAANSNMLATQEYVDNKKKVFTATIPTTGWATGETKYIDVTAAGMLETDYPHITPVYTNVKATDDAIQEAWNKIKRATAMSGKLRVYADEIPTTAIPVQIEVVR